MVVFGFDGGLVVFFVWVKVGEVDIVVVGLVDDWFVEKYGVVVEI